MGQSHLEKEERVCPIEKHGVWGTAGIMCPLKLAAAVLDLLDILVCLSACLRVTTVCVCVCVFELELGFTET